MALNTITLNPSEKYLFIKNLHNGTWLCDFDVKYFLYMSVVGCDLEYSSRRVLYTRYINRDYIFRNPLPAHILPIPVYSEYLCP